MGLIPLTGGGGVSRIYTPIVQQVSSSIRKVADQLLGIETATVVSNELSATETVVVFDNDPSGEQVVARSITGTYEVDTRVYCLKYPPNGVLILGRNDGKLRLNTTGDVSLSSTGHAFQIGQTSGINMRMDNNEILVVNNGGTASLNLQTNGGRVELFDQQDGTFDLNNSGMIAPLMRLKQDQETTNISGITSTTPTLGAPTNGFTFVAPPSGAVAYSCGAYMEMDGDAVGDDVMHFYGELREGGSIGSGTVVHSGDGDDGPHVAVGVGTTTTQGRAMCGSIPYLVTGLTAGDTYNVSGWYYVTSGTGAIFTRQVALQPQP